jgi:PAS domain S-box-containing protein
MSKVFMDAADPILIEDLEGCVIDMNQEAERSYGWSRDELLGKPITTIVPESRHEQALELLARCKSDQEVRNIEGIRRTRSNLEIPVLVTLSLLRGEDGEPAAIASLAKDISDQKAAELELRQYQDQLEALVARRTAELEDANVLRRTPNWRDVPVIVTTAKNLTPEDHKALSGVVEAVLQKNASSLDDLMQQVRGALDPESGAATQ